MKTKLVAPTPARGFPNPQHAALAERVRTSPPQNRSAGGLTRSASPCRESSEGSKRPVWAKPLRLWRAALLLPLLAAAPLRAQVQFTAARYSMWETGRTAVITVTRSTNNGPGTVTVNYATSDGTATAGQDGAATSGTLTFGPGEAEKSFTLPILDDAFPEGDALVAANGRSPQISR